MAKPTQAETAEVIGSLTTKAAVIEALSSNVLERVIVEQLITFILV